MTLLRVQTQAGLPMLEGRRLNGRVDVEYAYFRSEPRRSKIVAGVPTTKLGESVLMRLSKRPFTRESIKSFAKQSLTARATPLSDGLGGVIAIAKRQSFLAVNTILGNLKAAWTGTYHAFGLEKYAHRYLAQVQYLFNRRFDLRLARAAC